MSRQLLDRLRYRWFQLDGFLQIALLLALINLGVQTFWLPVLDHEQQSLQRELAYLKGQRRSLGTTADDGATAHFPASQALVPVMRRIEALAQDHELLFTRSSGQFGTDANSKTLRVFQAELDLEGRYADQHAFIDELLRQLPYAAIHDLTWSRAEAGTPDITLHCSLRLFLTP